MHETRFVRCREAVGNLDGNVQQLFYGQRAGLQPVPERCAVDELRDDERHVALGADIVDDQDVGMIERAGGARLLQQSRAVGPVEGVGSAENLQRDAALQSGITRPVDLAHTARPKRTDDLVRAER